MQWGGVSSLFVILGFGSSECHNGVNFQEILFLSEGEILEISTQPGTLYFIISFLFHYFNRIYSLDMTAVEESFIFGEPF